MANNIVLIIMTAVFLFVPLLLHKSHKGFMVRFCVRMTAQPAARKLYRLMLLIVLLVFHFMYLSVHLKDAGILGSTLAFTIFFGFMDVDRLLHRLHEERKTLCITALTVLVFAFTPFLFTLAVTLYIILLAALFYPSYRVLSLWENKNDRMVMAEDSRLLISYYY